MWPIGHHAMLNLLILNQSLTRSWGWITSLNVDSSSSLRYMPPPSIHLLWGSFPLYHSRFTRNISQYIAIPRDMLFLRRHRYCLTATVLCYTAITNQVLRSVTPVTKSTLIAYLYPANIARVATRSGPWSFDTTSFSSNPTLYRIPLEVCPSLLVRFEFF